MGPDFAISADPEHPRFVTPSVEHRLVSPLPRRLPLPSEMPCMTPSPHSGTDTAHIVRRPPVAVSPSFISPSSFVSEYPLPKGNPSLPSSLTPLPPSRPQSPLVSASNSDTLQVLVHPVTPMTTPSPAPTTPPDWVRLKVCSRLFLLLN